MHMRGVDVDTLGAAIRETDDVWPGSARWREEWPRMSRHLSPGNQGCWKPIHTKRAGAGKGHRFHLGSPSLGETAFPLSRCQTLLSQVRLSSHNRRPLRAELFGVKCRKQKCVWVSYAKGISRDGGSPEKPNRSCYGNAEMRATGS